MKCIKATFFLEKVWSFMGPPTFLYIICHHSESGTSIYMPHDICNKKQHQ